MLRRLLTSYGYHWNLQSTADGFRDLLHGHTLFTNRVIARASRITFRHRLLQRQPVQTGGVEPMHRWPTRAAITNKCRDTFFPGDCNQVGNETLLDGARCELVEETRLSPARLFQVEFECTFALEEEWKWAYAPGIEFVKEFVFLAEIVDRSEPNLSFEHDLYEWMPFTPAMARLKWPNNKRAIEFCNRLLTS